jgi:polar amino acid transport system permease protein
VSHLAFVRYLPVLLQAAVVTIYLSAMVIVGGTVLGAVLGLLARWSRAVRLAVEMFVYVMRGVPLLVHVFAAYFCLPLVIADISRVTAVALAMSLYMAAFVSEIVRGAIDGVPHSAVDAARSLGMPPSLAMRRVILPLAVRLAVPPLVNRTVMTIKGTSLASAVGLWELSLAGREIIQRDLAPFQVFGLVAAIYFCLCSLIAHAGRRLEAKFAYEH